MLIRELAELIVLSDIKLVFVTAYKIAKAFEFIIIMKFFHGTLLHGLEGEIRLELMLTGALLEITPS